MGIKTEQFVPQKLKDKDIYKKLTELIDFVMGGNEENIKNVLLKYANFESIDIDAVNSFIKERGFDYIINLLGITDEQKINIAYYLTLIEHLKGTKRGVLFISDLLNADAVVREWWEEGGNNIPYTYELSWSIPTGYPLSEVEKNVYNFLENYIYPKLYAWYILFYNGFAFDGDDNELRGFGDYYKETNYWQPTTYYNTGDIVVPTSVNAFYYRATNDGISGNSEPVWSTTVGGFVSDGQIQWEVLDSTATDGGLWSFSLNKSFPHIIELTDSKKNQGWLENEKPLLDWFGWIWRTYYYQYLKFIPYTDVDVDVVITDFNFLDSYGESYELFNKRFYNDWDTYQNNMNEGDRVLIEKDIELNNSMYLKNNVRLYTNKNVSININNNITNGIILEDYVFVDKDIKINVNSDLDTLIYFKGEGSYLKSVNVCKYSKYNWNSIIKIDYNKGVNYININIGYENGIIYNDINYWNSYNEDNIGKDVFDNTFNINKFPCNLVEVEDMRFPQIGRFVPEIIDNTTFKVSDGWAVVKDNSYVIETNNEFTKKIVGFTIRKGADLQHIDGADDATNWGWSFYLKPDGTKLWRHSTYTSTDRQSIYEYDLTTPFDLDTITNRVAYSMFPDDNRYGDAIYFSDDGYHLYVSYNSGPSDYKLIQYKLGTPWNLSTATQYAEIDVVDDIDSQLTALSIQAIWVSPNGMHIFTIHSSSYIYKLMRLDLTTAFDITSWNNYQIIDLPNVSSEINTLEGLLLNKNMNKLFAVSYHGEGLFEYDLPNYTDLNTITFKHKIYISTYNDLGAEVDGLIAKYNNNGEIEKIYLIDHHSLNPGVSNYIEITLDTPSTLGLNWQPGENKPSLANSITHLERLNWYYLFVVANSSTGEIDYIIDDNPEGNNVMSTVGGYGFDKMRRIAMMYTSDNAGWFYYYVDTNGEEHKYIFFEDSGKLGVKFYKKLFDKYLANTDLPNGSYMRIYTIPYLPNNHYYSMYLITTLYYFEYDLTDNIGLFFPISSDYNNYYGDDNVNTVVIVNGNKLFAKSFVLPYIENSNITNNYLVEKMYGKNIGIRVHLNSTTDEGRIIISASSLTDFRDNI